jgi:hypothetical protein
VYLSSTLVQSKVARKHMFLVKSMVLTRRSAGFRRGVLN